MRAFFESLGNATYGTFKDVLMDNKISPNDYLYFVKFLHDNITYIISNSHVDIFSTKELVPTIAELGICYTYNGEIAPYNDYEWESHIVFYTANPLRS